MLQEKNSLIFNIKLYANILNNLMGMTPRRMHDFLWSQHICHFNMNYGPEKDKYSFNLVIHKTQCMKIQSEASHWTIGFLLLVLYFKPFLKES